jgi:hypothetical protein
VPYHTRLCRSREGDQSIRLPASGRASTSRVRQVGPPPSGDGYPVERGCFPCLTASFAQLPMPGDLSGKGVAQIMKPLRLAPPLSKRSKTMHPPGYRQYLKEFLSRTTSWVGPGSCRSGTVEGRRKTARLGGLLLRRPPTDEIDDTGKRSQLPPSAPTIRSVCAACLSGSGNRLIISAVPRERPITFRKGQHDADTWSSTTSNRGAVLPPADDEALLPRRPSSRLGGRHLGKDRMEVASERPSPVPLADLGREQPPVLVSWKHPGRTRL